MKTLTASAVLLPIFALASAAPETPDAAPTAAGVSALVLPGAPAEGVALDYLAIDRARHRVWVPAGGTGTTVVIDTGTQEIRKIEKFPTKEVERQGKKRVVGPSSATIGDGFVYVGNRADSSVCAIDAATLERGGCVTLASSPDGVAFVPRTKEVWVTTPRDNSIAVLDVSKPAELKLRATIKLDGAPEGYAVDDGRGFFYTNLEDKDRTLRIDIPKRKVIATWKPECGEQGPRGVAIEPVGQLLTVVCAAGHLAVLDGSKKGHILSKLDTGEGVDNIDYVPATRTLYAAASKAATMTVAHLGEKGELRSLRTVSTVKGARNAVAADDGTAFVADGPDGRILVVTATSMP